MSGQEVVAPLRSNPLQVKKVLPRAAAKTTATLSLPFFEDFTGYAPYADSSRWTDYEIYINNTMCVRPIARGVATFDALDKNGLPYNLTSSTVFGYADSLTSQPIDLGGLTAADSVYLSFFYQPQGNGFYPLPQDSLMLFLKTKYGGFVKVWSIPGRTLQPFTQVMIPITDSLYLHDNFQFRFINIAALYWADAVWNVDYIRLDRNRTRNDTAVNDIGYSADPSFLLNDYSSMPYRHFMSYPMGERAIRIADSINNNYDTPEPVTYNFTATALNTGAVLQTPVSATATFPPRAIAGLSFPAYTAAIPSTSVGRYEKVLFEHKFSINNGPSTGSLANDTIVKNQVFDNYLAYDDGSAEKSYYLNLFPTLPGKLAIEYHLNEPDTMQGMAIYFGRQIPLAYYKLFSITVYSELQGVNGAIADNKLYEQELNVPGYMDSVNHFWIYKFDKPLPLPVGTFYAGTIQPAESGSDSLYFGLDVNRIGGNHAYYNLLNIWNPSLISGAIMMRPLLGQPVTGSNIENIKVDRPLWTIGPNPAHDYITFEFKSDGPTTYQITDMTGRALLAGNLVNGDNINISQLIPGIYIVYLSSNGVNSAPQKIIKL